MADPDKKDDLSAYPADKARQGEIVLRSRTRRWIFIAGLIAFALVVILVPVLLSA